MKQMSDGQNRAIYAFGGTRLEVVIQDNKVWLSQKQIAELLGLPQGNISRALKTGLESGLIKGVINLITPTSGGNQNIPYYDLDAVLYVTYRANPRESLGVERVVSFKEWAVTVLDRKIVKDIRLKERGDYSQVKDLIAFASDYDPASPTCAEYFASIQNKLLYAVTNMTAPEIITRRVNADTPNMGLQTWESENIRKQDVFVAKNYLTEKELKELHMLVTAIVSGAYFRMVDKTATMQEWVNYVDEQIILFRRDVLMGKGTYSRKEAERLAAREYEQFKQRLLTGKVRP